VSLLLGALGPTLGIDLDAQEVPKGTRTGPQEAPNKIPKWHKLV